MNTEEIKCVINCDPVMRYKVLGVFARDQIPALTYFPCALIVNTDTSDLPGKHWIAFYYESKEKSEFFDSYGHSPDYFDLNAQTYNETRVQSSISDTCGQFCLYYLLNRCRGVSMTFVVREFSANLETNDRFVKEYIGNSYPYCFNKKMNIHKPYYQLCCAETNI